MPLALAAGISNEQLHALQAGQIDSALFDERQRAALAYAGRVAQDGDVDDRTFAQLEAFFDAREIVELTLTVAFYAGTASLLKALDVRPE